MKRILFIFLLIALAHAGVTHAQPLLIVPDPVSSNEETLTRFTRLLKPTPENDIFMEPIMAETLGPGSHLRIWYRSKNPVPVEYGPLRMIPYDVLAAVLPLSEEGDVLLPLMDSPSWNPREKGVFLRMYGLQNSPPEITKLRVEDHLSSTQKFFAIFSQFFQPERFTYSSMSELKGYRVAHIPATLLLGLLFLLGTCVLSLISFLRGDLRLLTKSVPLLCLLFLILYQIRFLRDFVPSVISLHRELRREEHFGHMGEIYAIADSIRKLGAKEGVLLCNPIVKTPLTYLLYPIPVFEPKDLTGSSPSIALVSKTWEEGQTSFECGPLRFEGSIHRLFADGEAIILPLSSAP